MHSLPTTTTQVMFFICAEHDLTETLPIKKSFQ
jgi:hypothetical protein